MEELGVDVLISAPQKAPYTLPILYTQLYLYSTYTLPILYTLYSTYAPWPH